MIVIYLFRSLKVSNNCQVKLMIKILSKIKMKNKSKSNFSIEVDMKNKSTREPTNSIINYYIKKSRCREGRSKFQKKF